MKLTKVQATLKKAGYLTRIKNERKKMQFEKSKKSTAVFKEIVVVSFVEFVQITKFASLQKPS